MYGSLLAYVMSSPHKYNVIFYVNRLESKLRSFACLTTNDIIGIEYNGKVSCLVRMYIRVCINCVSHCYYRYMSY